MENAFQSPIDMQWGRDSKFTALTQIMIFGKLHLCQKGELGRKERSQYSPLLQPGEMSSCCLNDIIKLFTLSFSLRLLLKEILSLIKINLHLFIVL